MKKTLVVIVSVLAILGIGHAVSACEEIDFDSYGTMCVDLIKNGNTYNLDIDYSNLSLSHSNAYYYVLLPNKKANNKNSGGGLLSSRLTDSYSQFSYNYNTYDGYDSEVRKIKVYAIIGNQVRSTEVYYDFANGDRSDENGSSSSSSNSNGNLDNFYLTTNDTTPSTSQYVNLTVKARDSSNSTITDFTDTINFKVYYRSSSSSSRIQTTSSTYYTMNSDYTDGYDFSSSNNGQKTFSSFIKFKKNNYDYKVRVYDSNDSSIYKEITFNVGSSSSSSSSNGDLDNFYVTTDNSSPSTNQYVDLNIKARDSSNDTITDFSDTVKFKVYYGHADSSSRTLTTSSSYYSMSSDYNSYGYDFNSSDNGYANLSNAIEFKNSSYDYKVRVYDVNDTSIYKEIIFYVNSYDNGNNNNNNGNINNFYVSDSNSSPDTNEWVNLTVKARDSDNSTVTDYTDNVDFLVYYRTSSSNARTKTTSSNYYTLGSSFIDGYDFNSSDYGIATLNNFIKFKQKYEYKVVVEDSSDTSANGYAMFDLRNQSSSVDGFSVTELEAVQTIYDSRNKMISDLKSSYPRLRSNSNRTDMSDTFYNNMADVINDASNKEFSDYSEYINAFTDRYSYTVDHR